ncbi:2-phospho-L-lactate transferase [Sporichthya sp.]|uniref:2-phospho-L-lactate transferase n=1 Tax=Sporichthya sp. TaxID=65475 RepID=UPI00180712FA|nr:2-phospho-L-lactate transferase [Sporichthya sp.]MBA3745791.1 2-phospho-L-lactate transferase [Sporichthya sp.]
MIVGLGGGVGASRLWRALLGAGVDPADLTVVVNTADDLWVHGLRVCPDLDTTLYALSGRQDLERGWGVRGESWRAMDALRDLGGEPWFNLGDLDLGTHLFRTGLLRDGVGLAEITQRLAAAMGVGIGVLPMTEDEVTSYVLTVTGSLLHFQEFHVARRSRDEVRNLSYRGIDQARPAPGLLEAILTADRVVIAPSNPLASIAPILALPGVREALRATSAPVVALTPIVSGIPITDPGEAHRAETRAGLLRSIGLSHSASSAASLLREVADAFVLDCTDEIEAETIAGCGLDVLVADTLATERPGGLVELPAVRAVLDYRPRGEATDGTDGTVGIVRRPEEGR